MATLRVERNPRAILNWGQVNNIRNDYAAGDITQQELADKYKLSISCISNLIRNKFWFDPDYEPQHFSSRRATCGSAVLTREIVRSIRAEYLAGTFTQKQLADKHGVKQPTI